MSAAPKLHVTASEKKPKIAQKLTTLELFQRNLAAMRLWYRKAAMPGAEVGVNIIHELVLANVMTALELALEGKEWIAPHSNP